MIQIYPYKKAFYSLNNYEWVIFLLGLGYALYWIMISPLQFTADSESYLSYAHMFNWKFAGMAPIFRTPGYPILLLLTGAVIPGTFIPLVLIQALFAALVPIIIYRILMPYGQYIALLAAIIAILSGTLTVHTSQVMSEALFTPLLFIGVYLAINVIRSKGAVPTLFYWLALTFAALNTVRPIAWPAFWLILIMITCSLGYAKQLRHTWKNIAGAAVIFISLMSLWIIVDDVLFSTGAISSPLVGPASDTRLETYLYDLPFKEAYFYPWKQRVDNISKDPSLYGTLNDRPAMKKIRDIVLKQITEDNALFNNQTLYPYQLFGKYAQNPKELADRIFFFPNYAYAYYIRSVIEQHTSKKERFA
ncbi:MAG: hypothetical protein Q8L68_05240, partial [Methylococcales bacterium]|nr:hypothetical protein [Methylococcales bacterium]